MNKTKLFLLPGLGCAPGFYDKTIQDLQKDWDVEEVNFGVHSIEEDADIVYNYVKGCKKDFIFVAHCFSALIVVNLLNRYRLPRLQGVVLCGSLVDFSKVPSEQIIGNPDEQDEAYKSDGVAVDKILEARSHIIAIPDVIAQLDMTLKIDYSNLAGNVEQEVLLIGSDKDGYFVEEDFEETISKFPNGVLVIVPGARHDGIVTHTAEYSEIISDWLESFEGGQCVDD